MVEDESGGRRLCYAYLGLSFLRRDKRGYTHPSYLSCRILLSSTCASTYRVRGLRKWSNLTGKRRSVAEARSRRSPRHFACRPGAIFSVCCCGGPEKKYHSKSIALLVNRLRNCFSDGRGKKWLASRLAAAAVGSCPKGCPPRRFMWWDTWLTSPGPRPTLQFYRNHFAANS